MSFISHFPPIRQLEEIFLVMGMTIWLLTAIDAGPVLWGSVMVIVAISNGILSQVADQGGWL